MGVQLDISLPAPESPCAAAAASAGHSHASPPAESTPAPAQPARSAAAPGPPAAPDLEPAAVATDYGVRPSASAPAALEAVPEGTPLAADGALPNGHHRTPLVGAGAGASGEGNSAAAAAVTAEEHGIVPGEPCARDLVAQRGVCGAVRVACRTLCPDAGLRRSVSDQQTVRGKGLRFI